MYLLILKKIYILDRRGEIQVDFKSPSLSSFLKSNSNIG